MTDRYQVVQNEEAFAFTDALKVLWASSILAARSPTWTVAQLLFAVDRARLRVSDPGSIKEGTGV